MRRRRFLITGLLWVSLLSFAGGRQMAAGSQAAAHRAAAGGVTLHYWSSTAVGDPAYLWMLAGIKLFEQQHPGDKVVIDKYSGAQALFTAFHAASIAGNGPDLVDLWTGLYTLREKSSLLPLNTYLSTAEKARLVGLNSMATNLDPVHNNFYGISSDIVTYLGYYNKALFKKAGIVGPPANYSQFIADLQALKKAGIQPIEDGGNAWIVATNFASFMMNSLPPAAVDQLRTGKMRWTNPAVVSALTDYVTIYRSYVNPDVLTEKNPSTVFLSGKAAMLWNDGSWDMSQYEKSLGKNLGFFFIPQKPGAISPGYIASGPGVATSATSYGKNRTLAVAFLKDLIDPGVMRGLIKNGAMPAATGINPTLFTDPLAKQLYNIVVQKTKQNKIWPLWDNYQAPAVDDALNKELGLAITGQTSPSAALQTVDAIWQTVPASQKS